MNSSTARLQLLAAAFLFSTGGAAIKSCTLSGWQVASFRSAIAALALFLLLPATRQRWSWRSVCVGAAYAATLILFVSATKLTTAANAIFLQSTAPLYILLLGPWLLREWMRPRDVAFMAVLALGLCLFFVGADPAFASAPNPFAGNVIAACSGVSWALTVVGFRWIGRVQSGASTPPFAAVVAGNLIAFVVCLPLALPLGETRFADWVLLVYLGVFQIGLAYVFVTAAIRSVPALEAALLLLLEPALNPVWAWLVHGERPGAWSLCGGALILLATALKSWADFRGTRVDRGAPSVQSRASR